MFIWIGHTLLAWVLGVTQAALGLSWPLSGPPPVLLLVYGIWLCRRQRFRTALTAVFVGGMALGGSSELIPLGVHSSAYLSLVLVAAWCYRSWVALPLWLELSLVGVLTVVSELLVLVFLQTLSPGTVAALPFLRDALLSGLWSVLLWALLVLRQNTAWDEETDAMTVKPS